MYSPRGSTGSDRSSCSSGFSSGGGPSHLKDWPLGRSATHERYIKPVPPMYVTEYEASYTWPKTVQKQNGSEAQPKPSKMTPWRELEETVEELEHLEQRYPTIFQVCSNHFKTLELSYISVTLTLIFPFYSCILLCDKTNYFLFIQL